MLIDIPPTKTGGLVVQQGAQIQEVATVKEVGPLVQGFKKGDVIHYKGWAVDIITVDGETFYYISSDSDALCGVVTKK